MADDYEDDEELFFDAEEGGHEPAKPARKAESGRPLRKPQPADGATRSGRARAER